MTAADRPLPLRTRAELQFRGFTVRGQRRWSVKDPISLRYYQLRDEERFLLEQLQQPRSLRQLKRAFDEQFAPRQVAVEELQWFLGALHRECLIVSHSVNQGSRLLDREAEARRSKWLSSFGNILAIRFRGVDAEPILARLYPWMRWATTPWFAVLCGAFILTVLGYAALHADEIQSRLPSLASLFTVKTVLWLMIALGLSKLLHELGHGLVCRRVGGECHEIGVMLLVFTPCLYCNVSDIWMQPDKWKRAAVSAAGIGVELVLAALAFVVWWNSSPGLLNSACFMLMIVGSVNSLLLNGNPLLRYDGYYVLSDLLEVPNLAAQSTGLLKRGAARLALGLEPQRDELGDFSRWKLLLVYGLASLAYRLVLIVMILWAVYRFLAPQGLHAFAYLLAIIVGFGLAMPLARSSHRFLRHPGAWRKMKWANLLCTSAIASALVYAGLVVPLPHRIAAPVFVQPVDARPVYVEIPGSLRFMVEAGTPVRSGETIVKMDDADLLLEHLLLKSKRDLQALHVAAIQERRVFEESLDSELPTAQQRLAALEDQLIQKTSDLAKLTLAAPCNGVVMAPRSRRPTQDPQQLESWWGAPSDPENSGCLLERGQLVCRVGDPRRLEALVVVPQSDVRFIAIGLQVSIQLDQLGGEFLIGQVAEVAEVDLEDAPPELIQAGEIVAKENAGQAAPASTSYLVRVQLANVPQHVVHRATGQARIHAARRSAFDHARHFLARTFGFEMVAL